MQLDSEQQSRLDRDGYLFFPALFSLAEIAVLHDEVPRLYAEYRQENVREKGSDAVRTNFAAHMYNEQFARLARHPRMVEPVKQLFDEESLGDIRQSVEAGLDCVTSSICALTWEVSALGASFRWGVAELLATLGGMADSLATLVQIARTPARTTSPLS